MVWRITRILKDAPLLTWPWMHLEHENHQNRERKPALPISDDPSSPPIEYTKQLKHQAQFMGGSAARHQKHGNSATLDTTDNNRNGNGNKWAIHILAAMCAGATSTIMTNPLWVIKTRFMVGIIHSRVHRIAQILKYLPHRHSQILQHIGTEIQLTRFWRFIVQKECADFTKGWDLLCLVSVTSPYSFRCMKSSRRR